MTSIAVGTIAAKPYWSYARVLAESFRSRHADIPFFVLLADDLQRQFRLEDEPFDVLTLDEIGFSDSPRFRFWYGQQELSYAMTPSLLAALLNRGFDTAVFLKQESLVVGDLTPILDDAGRHPISLTPHLLAPLAGDQRIDRELNVLQSGAYNAGWVAVTESPVARRFLGWWRDRVRRHCRHEVSVGTHFEQRWLDLVPSYFEDVHLIRDPTVNVGHWNMAERPVRLETDGMRVNGRPCRFVRFSGYEPDHPERMTRYWPDRRVADLGDGAAIFRLYQGLLERAGHDETRAWPYAFARFSNGVPIPEVARRLLADVVAEEGGEERFVDPFETSGVDSYFEWLRSPPEGVDGASAPTHLWLAVHGRRPDLQRAYPEPLGRDRAGFVSWTSRSGMAEHGVAEAFAIHGAG